MKTKYRFVCATNQPLFRVPFLFFFFFACVDFIRVFFIFAYVDFFIYVFIVVANLANNWSPKKNVSLCITDHLNTAVHTQKSSRHPPHAFATQLPDASLRRPWLQRTSRWDPTLLRAGCSPSASCVGGFSRRPTALPHPRPAPLHPATIAIQCSHWRTAVSQRQENVSKHMH